MTKNIMLITGDRFYISKKCGSIFQRAVEAPPKLDIWSEPMPLPVISQEPKRRILASLWIFFLVLSSAGFTGLELNDESFSL